MSYVGKNIKRFRKDKGLTQKQLSEMTGIAKQQIGHYEQGIKNPRSPTLKKIARALDVSESQLLSINDDWETIFEYYDNLTIGQRIEKYREQRDLTQEELSQLSNVSNEKIILFEHDLTIPSLNDINKISNSLKLNKPSLLLDYNHYSKNLTLGQKIQWKREDYNVSLDYISNTTQISKDCILQYENNIIVPSFDALKKIAKAIHISVNEFLPEDWYDLLKNTDISLYLSNNELKIYNDLILKEKESYIGQAEFTNEDYNVLMNLDEKIRYSIVVKRDYSKIVGNNHLLECINNLCIQLNQEEQKEVLDFINMILKKDNYKSNNDNDE